MRYSPTLIRWLDSIRKNERGLWKMVCPRVIQPPNGFTSPIYFALHPLALMKSLQNGEPLNPSSRSMLAACGMLIDLDTPTYFVREDFCRAVAATELPEETTLEDVKWPMDAMLFVLPPAFMREYTGGIDVDFTAATKLPGHDLEFAKFRFVNGSNEPAKLGNDRPRSIFYYTPWTSNAVTPQDYAAVYPLNQKIKDVINCQVFTDYTHEAEERLKTAYPDRTIEGLDREADLELQRKMNSLTIKLLLAVSTRPELIEMGKVVRPKKVTSGGVKDEIWSANVIGRNYRIIREHSEQTKTGISPRMHWRRGHFRQQKFGLGHSMSKLIWIEPVLVNALDKE